MQLCPRTHARTLTCAPQVRWLRSAAMLANADAHFYLGLHLRTRSPAQFVTHMTTAIGLGSTEAAMELARHYDVGPADGTAGADASAKAVELYSRAAAAGETERARSVPNCTPYPLRVPAPDEAGEAERDRAVARAVAAEAEAGRAELADAAAAAAAGEVVRPLCALCGRTCEGPRHARVGPPPATGNGTARVRARARACAPRARSCARAQRRTQEGEVVRCTTDLGIDSARSRPPHSSPGTGDAERGCGVPRAAAAARASAARRAVARRLDMTCKDRWGVGE